LDDLLFKFGSRLDHLSVVVVDRVFGRCAHRLLQSFFVALDLARVHGWSQAAPQCLCLHQLSLARFLRLL